MIIVVIIIVVIIILETPRLKLWRGEAATGDRNRLSRLARTHVR